MPNGPSEPLAGTAPLIDVHAHFYYSGCGRTNWRELNEARFRAGSRIGVTYHVGSILGSWGATSPTYFQSLADTLRGNDAMIEVERSTPDFVRSYAAVNPNDGTGALQELQRCLALGAVGVKLTAARRVSDGLLRPIIEFAETHSVPVLHHVWQHRRHAVIGQDISDGTDIAEVAMRHPKVHFILAHIGGGGDYGHTFAAVRDAPNVYLDLSGSGVDRGMLDAAVDAVGARRLVWGADLTMETGLAKLWALEVVGLSAEQLADIRWRNAVRIFPAGTFPRCERVGDGAARTAEKARTGTGRVLIGSDD